MHSKKNFFGAKLSDLFLQLIVQHYALLIFCKKFKERSSFTFILRFSNFKYGWYFYNEKQLFLQFHEN